MSNLEEEFFAVCKEHISREGSEELISWLEESDYFTAPASTKFHGNYPGGLLEHHMNVYKCLKNRVALDAKGAYDGICHEAPSEETLAITALFHDLCKVNFYKKGFRNVKVDGQWTTKEVYEVEEKFPCGDHADKSIIILQNFIRLTPDEIFAIRAHMGGYDSAVRGGSQFVNRIFDRCRLAVHLHIADMEASHLIEKTKE